MMMYANCNQCGSGYWCDVEGPILGLCSRCAAEHFRTTPVAGDEAIVPADDVEDETCPAPEHNG